MTSAFFRLPRAGTPESAADNQRPPAGPGFSKQSDPTARRLIATSMPEAELVGGSWRFGHDLILSVPPSRRIASRATRPRSADGGQVSGKQQSRLKTEKNAATTSRFYCDRAVALCPQVSPGPRCELHIDTFLNQQPFATLLALHGYPLYHLGMPMDMKALAQLGARARLSQLQEEMNELKQAFPDLGSREPATPIRRRGRRPKVATESPVEQSAEAPQEAAPAVVRKRKPMTAAQKRSVGERMKKYWAARRKAEKKG
jgi:hypothetical protein